MLVRLVARGACKPGVLIPIASSSYRPAIIISSTLFTHVQFAKTRNYTNITSQPVQPTHQTLNSLSTMSGPVAHKRVAILTGCSSGIGLQTALLMLKQEYKVFGLDINQFDTKILEELQDGKYLEHFTFHQANLLEEGACDKAVAACLEKFRYVSLPFVSVSWLGHMKLRV